MQTITKIKEWLLGKKSERCSQCDNASTDACHAHYTQLEIDKGTAFACVDQSNGEDETVLAERSEKNCDLLVAESRLVIYTQSIPYGHTTRNFNIHPKRE